MDNITQIIQAIQTHAWYSVAALALTLAILVWKQVQPQVWAKIPEKWQWVPAVVLAAVTAFVAAWQTGATVVQAVAVALFTALTGGTSAIGLHHTGKQLFGKALPLRVSDGVGLSIPKLPPDPPDPGPAA